MRRQSRITTIRGHSFYTGLINRESIVVDFGAHKGEFASRIRSDFGCKCILVEALPSLYSQIVDGPLVQKYHFAMASRDAPVELFISKNIEGNTITGSSTAGSDGSVTVEGVTLGTFMTRAGIDTIDLLKMDIEGAEIGLIQTASDEIFSKITQITVEFHDFVPGGGVSAHQVAQINKRLQDLGFYVIKFSRSLNTDVLFINRKLSGISTAEYWYIKYINKYFHGISRLLRSSLNLIHGCGQ